MIAFRHADPRFLFLWESIDQPGGRWHRRDDGPVQYLADTPDGAWAEFLRHEEIKNPAELEGVRRSLWAIEVEEDPAETPRLPDDVLLGGPDTYPRCQAEAARLRGRGTDALVAPSAALLPGAAHGWRVDGGVQPGVPRDGRVIVLFGPRPRALGWQVVDRGPPPASVLPNVRHFV